MARVEKISQVEAEGRKREANIKKNKKRDFRRWANKYMAPGTLPMKIGGIGEGTINYCPDCDLKCTRSILTDKWRCKDCGAETITMTKDGFNEFRKAQNEEV